MGERRKRESPQEKKEKTINIEKGLKAGKETDKKKHDKRWQKMGAGKRKKKKQAKGNMQKPVQK